jgi:putative transcriptional regulator
VDVLTGQLLIANANLFDPNFRRAVILIGHHDEDGAIGVVLNRSLGITVREAVPPLGELVEPDEPLFSGGPVQADSVVVVADFTDPTQAQILAVGSIGFLPPETDDDVLTAISRARVFAGYAGWSAGQLEAELREDSWVLEPASPADVFHPEPGRLWQDVLRRKGRAYDMLRLMPEDPSMN